MWYGGFTDNGYGFGYGGGIDDTLTIGAVTIPANANLDFMTCYDVHSSDSARVEISTDGGASWSNLTGTLGASTLSTITGTSGGWVPARYDLSAYAGQTVSIRFHYTTDYRMSWAGIGIDNISIGNGSETVFADDAEADNPALQHGGLQRHRGRSTGTPTLPSTETDGSGPRRLSRLQSIRRASTDG